MGRLAALVCFCIAFSLWNASAAGSSVPGKDFTETGCDGYSDSVARLYTAGLGREPERGGFEFWFDEYTSGRWDLTSMAGFFTQSPEFHSSYGSLTQDGFIRQLYRNVLGREGEQGGVEFWNSQMNAGMSRGTVLLRFAESPENITNSGTAQPILGPFNEGRIGPWVCVGTTPASPGDARDCVDFATQAEAQAWFDRYLADYGDIAGLDSDGDGTACEELVEGPVFTPQPEPEAPAPDPTPAAPARPSNPGNTKNCSDFGTQAEAQAWFDRYFPFYGDVARLDADDDGRACESLP